MILLLVMAGGAIGAVIRGALSRLNGAWPYGTLTANLLGSFALGVVVTAADDPFVLVVGGGLLGSLTTFSTVAVEGVSRPAALGGAYLIISVAAGVGCAVLGLAIGARLAI